MATTVASLRILLGLDSKDVRDGAGSVKNELKGVQTEAKKTQSTLSEMKAGLATGVGIGAGFGAFQLAAKGAALAVNEVVQIGTQAISSASALNETMSKSSVVFGQSAEAVSKWGDTAAKSLGLSKQAAVEAAASFGNLFEGMGLAQGPAAQMSQDLVGLASDLASFNNISTSDALQKLRSGLVGEAEPLRSVGVLLNEATVAAKAAQLGFEKVNGAFTEAQKVQARYALILEQTKTAQGDFARTSDGLANSQRIANAAIEDASARLGQSLLPVVAKASQGVAELAENFAKAVPAIEAAAGILGQALEAAFAPLARATDALRAVGLAAPITSNAVEDAAKAVRILQAEQARLTSEFDRGNISYAEYRDKMNAATAAIDRFTAQGKIAAVQADNVKDSYAALGGEVDHLAGAQAYATRVAEGHAAALGTTAGKMNDLYAPTVGMVGVMGGLQAATEGVKTASEEIIGPLSAEEAMLNRVAFAANTAGRNLAAMGTAAVKADKDTTDRLRRLGEVPGLLPGGLVGGGGPTVQPGDYTPIDWRALLPNAPAPPRGGGRGGRASTAAADANRAADELDRRRVASANDAFDRMADAAHEYFDELHKANLKAIDDAQKAADAQIEAQKRANLQPATAAEERLRAVQRQRQLASLQADLAAAKTPEERLRATQALSDFQAQGRIDFLRKQADDANQILDDQKKAQDQRFADQRDAENRRSAEQVNLFNEDLKALREYIGKHPAEWKKATDRVMGVLKAAGVDYEKAGKDNADAYIRGINKSFSGFGTPAAPGAGTKGAPGAAVPPSPAAAAAAGLTYVGGGVKGDVYLDGNKVGEFIEHYLAANASATTSGYVARRN